MHNRRVDVSRAKLFGILLLVVFVPKLFDHQSKHALGQPDFLIGVPVLCPSVASPLATLLDVGSLIVERS
jgi:hypothetical protein